MKKHSNRDIAYLRSFNKAFGELPIKVKFRNILFSMYSTISKATGIPMSILIGHYNKAYTSRNEFKSKQFKFIVADEKD